MGLNVKILTSVSPYVIVVADVHGVCLRGLMVYTDDARYRSFVMG